MDVFSGYPGFSFSGRIAWKPLFLRTAIQSDDSFFLKRKISTGSLLFRAECIRRLSNLDIENSFLLEIERRVSADSVIVLDQVEYEVDYRFAKQRIRLRYSPDLKDIFIVEADGTLTPIRLLSKTDNANIKRDKIHLCRGEE